MKYVEYVLLTIPILSLDHFGVLPLAHSTLALLIILVVEL